MFDKTKFLRIHDDATPEPSPQQREVRHDAPCRHCNAPTLMWRGEPWCFDCGDKSAVLPEGEKGTYSDPKCSLCPWVALDDDHLERIHAQWLALSPQGREACARYYAEACVAAINDALRNMSKSNDFDCPHYAACELGRDCECAHGLDQAEACASFWLRQGRHH